MKTLCVALLLIALPAAGARFKYVGKKVTVLIPDGIELTPEKFMAFPVLTSTFESDGQGGVRFAGVDPASRIPRLRECTASGPAVPRKKPDQSRLEVICPGEGIWHLFTPTSDLKAAEALVDQFVVAGPPDSPAAQALLEKAVARVMAPLFAKELASVPEERRSGLVAALRKVGAGGVEPLAYRDALYLSVSLGPHGNVFNTIQMNRTQRVARVTTEQLIPALREIERGLAGTEAIQGVALEVEIAYKNFLKPDNAEAGLDRLEILVPRAELAKLADDEITSQQLVNASVVRLNGNRIEVDLSQQ
ncbi:MAG: hypothetical protein QOH06_5288 [Acidobacteriota bacterium]|jgi:hypothetical protein|nr:hypothetical protein [Acidobacteriota bacterium]